MKNIKTFEDHTTVKLSDIMKSKNLSAEYHVNKTKGKKPYLKKDEIFTEIDNDKSIPKGVVYLTPEQVKKYNKLGKELIRIKEEQKSIIDEQKSIINK